MAWEMRGAKVKGGLGCQAGRQVVENRVIQRQVSWLLPRILAVMTIFLAASQTEAAEVRLQWLNEVLVELSGGSGRQAWRLDYGLLAGVEDKPLLVAAEGNRAWYAYGGWLRLIDAQKGQVLGRWHFPTVISTLKPRGTLVDVELTEKLPYWIHRGNKPEDIEEYVTIHVTLDPASPRIPFWPLSNLMRYRIPFLEVQNSMEAIDLGTEHADHKISAADAGKVLPQLQDMVRRDPFAPWFGVALGRVMKDIGDRRASAALQGALNFPQSDFTELLPISAYLDGLEEHDLARAAFERGYRNFWESGNDPRQVLDVLGATVLYHPQGKSVGDPNTEAGRETVERVYRLAPYATEGELVWRLYANYWSNKGDVEQARFWQARAKDAAAKGRARPWTPDIIYLFVPLAFLAATVYWLVLYLRYRPQRRFDLAATRLEAEPLAGFAISNVRKWRPIEQVGLLVSVVAAWILGFWARRAPVDGLFRAFQGFYYVLPVALLYLALLYVWHRLRPALAPEGKVQNGGIGPRHWLDVRRWGWLRRLGLVAVPLVSGTIAFLRLPPESDAFTHLLRPFYGGLAGAFLYLFAGFVYDRARRPRISPVLKPAVRRPRSFALLNIQYWSRRERFAFFGIVCMLWFGAGLVGLSVDGFFRHILYWRLGGQMGSLASPVTVRMFESEWLTPSPYRDLLLGMAYQQHGESEKAERLYRGLPHFAESWNNLGVILKIQGKDKEARQAFEKALQLDPSLSEATLNLGSPPVDLWTELHQKYLSGQPMFCPPRMDHWRQAFMGGSNARIFLRALLGPFAVPDPAWTFGFVRKALELMLSGLK